MDVVDHELARLGTILVEDGVLRRLIKGHLKLRNVGLRVPHDHCHVLAKAELSALADRPGHADLSALPDRVILVTGDRKKLVEGDPDALTQVWRSVFHASIHQELDALRAAGRLSATEVRARIDEIGQAEFDEIRSVLAQEDLLVPPADDAIIYTEFVALYLELREFAPRSVEHTFPALAASLSRSHPLDETLRRDLDPAALLARSRPERAPARPLLDAVQPIDPYAVSGRLEYADRGARKDATRASEKGNFARAAIYAARSGDRPSARANLEELVLHLGRALGTAAQPAPTQGWVEALMPVAHYAGTQQSLRWNVGARLLHDLQAACTVAEREVKVVDVVSWALSLGKRAVVRALPSTREVRMAKHLHAASDKVTRCELGDALDRERLAEVLNEVTRRADANVREVLRPKVEAALDEVGLHPHSLPERVAEKKLVDELLDRAVAVGRLTLGDLRDTLSHNDLKMPDLTIDALRSGDQLLRADRILSRSMDGVYRGGEVYLRFLQKLSSVVFGTPVGRVLTLYALLPLLGAFAVVEGLQHMIGPLAHLLFGVHPEIATATTQLGGAAFLFLLIHVPRFRRLAALLARGLWRVIKFVLWDIPMGIWRHPIVRRIVDSGVNRWIVRPAIPALIVLALIRPWYRWPIAGGVMVVLSIALNSRYGRFVEEQATDWAVRSGRQFTGRILPGLAKYILELFGKLADLVDRGLYRVDEWLRFRTGQSVVSLVIKGVLGTIWFVIAYVLRLYVDLFIEPTTNPIKHFPVVTVAAKILLPFTPSILTGVAGPAVQLLGPAVGNSFAAFTVLVIPGFAGFLVWELKENWKLYRASRPATLGPLSIGHHGETMVGFLRPGFHSGTIPKLFTRLRRAAWRSDEKGIAKQHAGLHHVEEAITKFVDRQLVSMLSEVAAFRATDVALEHIDIGSNRVQLTLSCKSISPEHARIRFELQSGWIVAGIPEPGWTEHLDAAQQQIFEIALAGFYKLSGVDLLREQLEQALRTSEGVVPAYDISEEGLVVWPGPGFETEAIYDLEADSLVPTIRGAPHDGKHELFDLGGRKALFGREPLYWSVWTTTWQQIARGEAPMKIISGPSLLRRSS